MQEKLHFIDYVDSPRMAAYNETDTNQRRGAQEYRSTGPGKGYPPKAGRSLPAWDWTEQVLDCFRQPPTAGRALTVPGSLYTDGGVEGSAFNAPVCCVKEAAQS